MSASKAISAPTQGGHSDPVKSSARTALFFQPAGALNGSGSNGRALILAARAASKPSAEPWILTKSALAFSEGVLVILDGRGQIVVGRVGRPAGALQNAGQDVVVVAARGPAGLLIGFDRGHGFVRVPRVQVGPGRQQLDRAEDVGLEEVALVGGDALERGRVRGRPDRHPPVGQGDVEDPAVIEGLQTGMVEQLDGHGHRRLEPGRPLGLGHEVPLQDDDLVERRGQGDLRVEDVGLDGLLVARVRIGGQDALELPEPGGRVLELGGRDDCPGIRAAGFGRPGPRAVPRRPSRGPRRGRSPLEVVSDRS